MKFSVSFQNAKLIPVFFIPTILIQGNRDFPVKDERGGGAPENQTALLAGRGSLPEKSFVALPGQSPAG